LDGFAFLFLHFFQHKNGIVLDQRSRQVKTSNKVEGHVEEHWEPLSSNKEFPNVNFGSLHNGTSPTRREGPCNNSSHIKLVNGKFPATNSSDNERVVTPMKTQPPGIMMSPHKASYSCRTTETADARVRNIRPNRPDFKNQRVNISNEELEDQVDFVDQRADLSPNMGVMSLLLILIH